MNICILVGTGKNVGLGHLKRCLSLAKELRKLSCRIAFNLDDMRYAKFVYEQKFEIEKQIRNTKYSMIIVDKYKINKLQLIKYKKHCQILVRLDDAAPKIMYDKISDVIINGNPYATEGMYKNYVKRYCSLIVGKDFIPMDGSFCRVKKKYKVRFNVKNITITLGGSDNNIRLAEKIAKTVASANLYTNIFVLNAEKLKNKMGTNVYKHLVLLPFVNEVEEVFVKSDIVISSASSTCWQLAAIGIPFIVFKTVSNQSCAFNYIKKSGIGYTLNKDDILDGTLTKTIKKLNRHNRIALSKKSRKKIDCNGAQRIAQQLLLLMRN